MAIQAKFRTSQTFTVSPTSGICQIHQMLPQIRLLEAKVYQSQVQSFYLVSAPVRSVLAQMEGAGWSTSKLVARYFGHGMRKHR